MWLSNSADSTQLDSQVVFAFCAPHNQRPFAWNRFVPQWVVESVINFTPHNQTPSPTEFVHRRGMKSYTNKIVVCTCCIYFHCFLTTLQRKYQKLKFRRQVVCLQRRPQTAVVATRSELRTQFYRERKPKTHSVVKIYMHQICSKPLLSFSTLICCLMMEGIVTNRFVHQRHFYGVSKTPSNKLSREGKFVPI